MINILHITTHMGGGVGKFLSQTTIYEKLQNSQYIHKIILLEEPKNSQFVDTCGENGVNLEVAKSYEDISRQIQLADIVVLHWWHSPTMCQFLADFPQKPTRLVLMSHISGCNYPTLPSTLAKLPDRLFFTSFYSYQNPLWTSEELNGIKAKSTVIYGLGIEASEIKHTRKIFNKDQFVITYVGTLSESKINPTFVQFCRKVIEKIPCAKFVMIGDLEDSEKILKDIQILRLNKNFNFVGYTKEVSKYLQESDVFGYPLNPFHFGTTENSVLEAMASGLPVVMLNQCTEKYIVENMYDGLLVNNELEYVKCMEYLYQHPEECERIGQNARNTVLSKYSMKKNVENMHKQFEELLREEKKDHEIAKTIGSTPIEWFLSCLGQNREMFEKVLKNRQDKMLLEKVRKCEPILKGKSKSSVQHFARTYPQVEEFKYLEKILQSV